MIYTYTGNGAKGNFASPSSLKEGATLVYRGKFTMHLCVFIIELKKELVCLHEIP